MEQNINLTKTPVVSNQRRNVILLALCQALFMTATSAIVTASALVGYNIADDKALSTLPLAMQFIAVMIVTAPASYLMKIIGRRNGIIVGLIIGIVGSALATVAIYEANFKLFCIACFLIGTFNAFGQYYRFAAADAAEESFKSRAISLVMAGGVIASLGPLLAHLSKDLLPEHIFAGVYLVVGLLYVASILTLWFVNIPRPNRNELSGPTRSLSTIVSQPVFIIAALAGVVSYMMMSLLMSSIPLAMASCGHNFFDTAQVIQWHVFAMFAPAFITGHLIRRFGCERIMMIGTIFIGACVVINLMGLDLHNFWLGGVTLGIGWCFLFIGATTLVTEAYTPAEKAKTQAANDFLIFGSVACAALLSGVLHELIGWEVMNYAVLPFLVLVLLSILRTQKREQKPLTS